MGIDHRSANPTAKLDKLLTVGRMTIGFLHWKRAMPLRVRWRMIGWQHWSFGWRWHR
jgi:hypothetical protein